MPRLMQTVRALVIADRQQAIKAMELFDDLVQSAITVIVAYMTPLVEMFLEFAGNKTLDDSIRISSITFIGVLTQTKKKVGLLHFVAICFSFKATPVRPSAIASVQIVYAIVVLNCSKERLSYIVHINRELTRCIHMNGCSSVNRC
jgi:hypothetical protein